MDALVYMANGGRHRFTVKYKWWFIFKAKHLGLWINEGSGEIFIPVSSIEEIHFTQPKGE